MGVGPWQQGNHPKNGYVLCCSKCVRWWRLCFFKDLELLIWIASWNRIWSKQVWECFLVKLFCQRTNETQKVGGFFFMASFRFRKALSKFLTPKRSVRISSNFLLGFPMIFSQSFLLQTTFSILVLFHFFPFHGIFTIFSESPPFWSTFPWSFVLIIPVLEFSPRTNEGNQTILKIKNRKRPIQVIQKNSQENSGCFDSQNFVGSPSRDSLTVSHWRRTQGSKLGGVWDVIEAFRSYRFGWLPWIVWVSFSCFNLEIIIILWKKYNFFKRQLDGQKS